MKCAVLILATVTVLGCAPDDNGRLETPTVPTAPRANASLWVMVIDSSGACIVGAAIEVLSGQQQGLKMQQPTPCDKWDVGGIELTRLIPSVEMTIRATAPGYHPEVKTFVPTTPPYSAQFFTPTKIE